MKIKGNITSLVTPMIKNKIDFKSLKKLINFQIKNGIKNVVILGTTGETSSLSTKEYVKIIKFCKKTIKNKMNIIVGNCSNSIKKSIFINKIIDKIKVNAILQNVPYYIIPSQMGIYKYFKFISSNTKTPIIIYDIPKRTGISLKINTIKKISKIKNIIGIKHSSKNIINFVDILRLKNKKFKIYCGDDIFFHINFLLGYDGNISVASNFIPKIMNKIYKYSKKNNIKKSNKEYFKIFNLLKILNLETNPIIVKYILNKMKMIKNKLRIPLTKIKKKNIKKIKNEINDFL
ncbi:4-hydroxy-tetrahydrodipicolinate synthase [Candidatus Vidania fulgoroideorum]